MYQPYTAPMNQADDQINRVNDQANARSMDRYGRPIAPISVTALEF
jgi:hypothetical protein